MIELTKLVLSEMIIINEGRILMLGSLVSYQPNPLLACYGATKAFIANYTDALINELKHTNVTATLLVPGLTDTVSLLFYSNIFSFIEMKFLTTFNPHFSTCRNLFKKKFFVNSLIEYK